MNNKQFAVVVAGILDMDAYPFADPKITASGISVCVRKEYYRKGTKRDTIKSVRLTIKHRSNPMEPFNVIINFNERGQQLRYAAMLNRVPVGTKKSHLLSLAITDYLVASGHLVDSYLREARQYQPRESQELERRKSTADAYMASLAERHRKSTPARPVSCALLGGLAA